MRFFAIALTLCACAAPPPPSAAPAPAPSTTSSPSPVVVTAPSSPSAPPPSPPSLDVECARDRAERAALRSEYEAAIAASLKSASEATAKQAAEATKRQEFMRTRCRRVTKPVTAPVLCVDQDAVVRVCSELTDVAIFYDCPKDGPEGARGLIGGGQLLANHGERTRVARARSSSTVSADVDAGAPADPRMVDLATRYSAQHSKDAQCKTLDGR